MSGRGSEETVSIFLIFPRVETRRAGISTWHPAGFGGTGCYGVIGPDPSAVLDKFKRASKYLRTGGLVKLVIVNKAEYLLRAFTPLSHYVYPGLNTYQPTKYCSIKTKIWLTSYIVVC